MSDETFTCPKHGHTLLCISPREAKLRGIEDNDCPGCKDAIENAPDVTTMTPQERADELIALVDAPLTVDVGLIHERAEKLVGRSVWTHEFAGLDYLCHEILTGSVPTMEGVIAKLPHDKPVIVARGDTDA